MSLPSSELFGRKRLEENSRDHGAATHGAETPPGPFRLDGREPSDGRLSTRDHDLLTGFGALEETRQMGFCRVDRVDLRHNCSLANHA